ncbi:MAG TPA: cytochrome c [Alphaproteobacteria bacterium]|nr:cytochrome c [Alphaproteobacteria bacterium]
MLRAKRLKRVAVLLMLCIGAIGLAPRSYGYNALVPLMISNLSRLQNLVVELAMSDFEGVAQAAKGLVGNAKAIRDLAHLVVTDQNPQQIKAFQELAHEFEEHAGRLEAAARARNAREVRTQVSEVLEYCLACHQQFRDQAAGHR